MFGGWPYLAYQYLEKAGGMFSEADWPYWATGMYPCMPQGLAESGVEAKPKPGGLQSILYYTILYTLPICYTMGPLPPVVKRLQQTSLWQPRRPLLQGQLHERRGTRRFPNYFNAV